MDVLRKELDSIYAAQSLDTATLDGSELVECRMITRHTALTDNDCRVITDAASDRCYIYSGTFASLIGLTSPGDGPYEREMNTSDEDEIYNCMHPEDLVDKRMLEYEFFKFVDSLEPDEKLHYRASCSIRIRRHDGEYMQVTNSTRIMRLSPHGKIWLILCTYDIDAQRDRPDGIEPCIIDCRNGTLRHISLTARRSRILTPREKEILLLIREGKPSKQIADILRISIHTVNRHRQNIIEKLSVGNSVEAIKAATEMKLF